MSGYVYILTNPSFKDNWVKIGKSARPVDVRSKELDNTAVPLPFEIYAVLETEKYNEAEAQIHHMIDLVNPDVRIRRGREFFNVTPEVALQILRQCALTLDDAKIVINEVNEYNNKSLDCMEVNSTTRRQSPKLTFGMLGIPIGSTLVFVENSSITARTVDDDNKIELSDGTVLSISAATRLVKEQLGTANTSGAYQGGNYWLFDGEKLTTIRAQLEHE